MTLIRGHRKAELLRRGVTQRAIASATGVAEDLVSHVMAGRRLGHPQAFAVMEEVARVLALPLCEVFPEAPDRRERERRLAERRQRQRRAA